MLEPFMDGAKGAGNPMPIMPAGIPDGRIWSELGRPRLPGELAEPRACVLLFHPFWPRHSERASTSKIAPDSMAEDIVENHQLATALFLVDTELNTTLELDDRKAND
ncbi:hypothetical protein RvY_18426-2 [Ramazzottius varieornatus]|uniref:Uncharacterized protein n=1 Tax=Ramazzottius varieornatus TaxID=947166 RepID=A0A1D1W5R9_RAMVA|nr:hypothetical protein RvY_18426-2 [Ramazzottius varieornatus]